jgi:hypothetical protein
VPVDDDEELGVCDLCGRPLDAEGEEAWLGVEIFRPKGDWINAVFCRQEHAAEWLAGPLPPVHPPGSLARTIKDRLVDWSLVALLLYAVVVMLLGSYTLVRLLGRWD